MDVTGNPSTTAVVTAWLAQLHGGDVSARTRLVEAVFGRLKSLAGRMLPLYPHVSRFVETDDVTQQTAVRLYRSLEAVTPPTARDFFAFAAVQMRRELIEMARRWAGKPRPGQGALNGAAARADSPDSTHDPATLQRWTEFHETAGTLPDEEREVFEMIWYHGLPTIEIADLLGLSMRTVQRRWASARLLMLDLLGELPF